MSDTKGTESPQRGKRNWFLRAFSYSTTLLKSSFLAHNYWSGEWIKYEITRKGNTWVGLLTHIRCLLKFIRAVNTWGGYMLHLPAIKQDVVGGQCPFWILTLIILLHCHKFTKPRVPKSTTANCKTI